MAVLSDKGYVNDICISYAHVDDDENGEKGWITRFHEDLELHLKRIVGKPKALKIWRDSDLGGLDYFDDAIEQSIKGSAIFVTFTSYAYLASDYCRREIKLFHDHISRPQDPYGVQVKNMSRIVNIRLYNIPPAEWLKECEGRTGYQLYSLASPGDEIGSRIEPDDAKFKALINNIAVDLRKLITEIASQQPVGGRQSVAGKKLFFASVSRTLIDTKNKVISELREQHPELEVITNIPPPEDEAAHDARVVAALGQSVLSVHLLNELPGRDIGGGAKTYPLKQAELAFNAPQVPQLIWVPKGLKLTPEEVENSLQRNFLQKLENGDYQKKNVSFIRSTEMDIAREIKSKLEAKVVRPEPATNPVVLIDTHVNDLISTPPMVQYLASSNIFAEVIFQLEDGGKNLLLLERKLAEVSSVLIVVGNAPQMALERIKEFFKLIISKQYPIRARGIYLPPRQLESNWRDKVLFYRDFDFLVLDDSQNQAFTPETFLPFVQQVITARGGAA